MTGASSALQAIAADAGSLRAFAGIAVAICRALRSGNKVLVCGNGGSMCDAMHFAEELTGRFRQDRPALAAIAISDASHITCVGNDYGFEHVFSRAVEALGQPGDVLIALSTSGNSPNILRAVETARGAELVTVALLGKDGGMLAAGGSCHHMLIVPGETSDRIQELHMLVLHLLVEAIEAELFPR
ncbi:MAG: D-sedoheptulose 7-phosphate isomerase [Phycisphaerales bacterium]|nr:D-sedoheptulose 7-phosphate isomerase [Phycisphaerales bacterium]